MVLLSIPVLIQAPVKLFRLALFCTGLFCLVACGATQIKQTSPAEFQIPPSIKATSWEAVIASSDLYGRKSNAYIELYGRGGSPYDRRIGVISFIKESCSATARGELSISKSDHSFEYVDFQKPLFLAKDLNVELALLSDSNGFYEYAIKIGEEHHTFTTERRIARILGKSRSMEIAFENVAATVNTNNK